MQVRWTYRTVVVKTLLHRVTFLSHQPKLCTLPHDLRKHWGMALSSLKGCCLRVLCSVTWTESD